MKNKIEDWEYIFMDTSIIIDLLVDPNRFNKDPLKKERILNTQKLFEYFFDSGKSRTYYISAISIAELTRGNNTNILDNLLQLFNNSAMTIVDFTKDIAIQISKNIKDYAPGYNINQLLAQLKKEIKDSQDVSNIRNWVNDDLKIVSTAKSLNKLDIILTADKKTFLPIAKKLKLPVLQTNSLPKDLFDEISTITKL
jgi:predicted nucleic acid-binding protein